ncbi:MAG: AbrB family transcriptional regulator [Thermoprotei archaeon]|nr:MAG: AbrB family transcriptional regulator [Thermoprotei archaeon]HDD64135.1 AbrB/MazE/SpoVT family DNA-binding domain-containing protein [Thermoprotei archaeon]
MKRVKVVRNYQITIPSEIRKAIGIEVGDVLLINVVDNKIILEKVKDDLPTFKVGKRIEEKDIEEALLKGLKRSIVGG